MTLNITPRTIFGRDNIDILPAINAGCIDLIYLDPPFNKKKDFTAPIGSSAEGASFRDIFYEEDVKDEWVKSIEFENPALHACLMGVKTFSSRYNYCYLVYMAIRLMECHRILKDAGSLYLHCDPTMSHYLKMIMDCLFGEQNFGNEIIWRIGWLSGFKTQKKGWIRNHDVILYYFKSAKAKALFNKEYIPYAPEYVRRDGKRPAGKGVPIEDTWNCSEHDRLDSIMIKSFSKEKTGYPTQKPLALLERIIKASSNEGDLVLDPFCGCATTCIAAERLRRQWIGIDVSVKAYELVKKRLDSQVPPDLFRGEPTYSQTPPRLGDDQPIKTGSVYVISNAAFRGVYKVGVSKNVEARLNSYQTSDPDRGYRLEYSVSTPHYREIEKHIHTALENKNEWVQADLARIKREIKTWLGKRGEQ